MTTSRDSSESVQDRSASASSTSTAARVQARLASMTITSRDRGSDAAAGPSVPVAGPSRFVRKNGKEKDKGKGKMRTAAVMTIGEKQRLRMSEKVAKTRAKQRKQHCSFIWVGGLYPTITEPMLEEAFKGCGTVIHVQIRATCGLAVVMDEVPKDWSSNDCQYASVEFAESGAAKRAVRLDGSVINGCKVKVCLNAIDLPGTQGIAIQEHINKKSAPVAPSMLQRAREAIDRVKCLTVNRTEAVIDPAPRANDRRLRRLYAPPQPQPEPNAVKPWPTLYNPKTIT